MLGTGRATVAQIADLARAAVSDGLPLEAVKAFASLGGEGKHPSNQERDLHNWLKRLFGFELETYNVLMDVNASRTQQLCFLRQYISLTSSLAPAFPFTSCCYPCLSLSRSLVLSAFSLCLSISSLSLSLLSLRTFCPSDNFLRLCEVEHEEDPQTVEIPFLLPHEFLHCLYNSGREQAW